jgi:6-phosphofructokinase 1
MKIGLLTSGGDSPGMNPCLAELVRLASAEGHTAIGYKRAFFGALEHDFTELRPIDTQSWYKLGGTVLKTARMQELKEVSRRKEIVKRVAEDGVGALIILGGDGSFRAALELEELAPAFNIVGIPCTIDNNIYGSDYTLGYDTALNKLVTYIDDISDTGISLPGRVFFVETLGGWDDFIPHSPVQMGMADFSVLAGYPMTDEEICDRVRECIARRRRDYVVVTFAEGPSRMLGAAEAVRKSLGVSVKCNMIGFQQRGGAPTATDRLRASGFARAALDAAVRNIRGKYVVYREGEYKYEDLSSAKLKKVFVR